MTMRGEEGQANQAATVAAGLVPSAPAPARAWREELRTLTLLALPLALSQLAVMAMTMVGLVMTGWLGSEHLGAASLANQTFNVCFLFGLGVGTAVAPLVAQARGARQPRMVRRSVRQGIWAVTAIGLPLMILLWYIEPVMLLLGQESGVSALARDYMRAMVWALLPQLWFVVLRAFVSALDRPRVILLITLVGIVVIAALDYVLIFGKLGFPALGIVGAGIGYSITQIIGLALLLGFVLRERRFKRYSILARFWRPDWILFKEVFRIGLPIAIAILLETALFAAAGYLSGIIGTATLAAHTVALQYTAIAFMVPLGISQAVTIRIGFYVGRRDAEAIGRAGWVACFLGCIWVALAASAFLIFSETLTRLFIDPGDPESSDAFALAVRFLSVVALFLIVDSTQVIGAGMLRGLKDTRMPVLYAAVGYWGVGFPLCLLFAFWLDLGGIGIWYGLAAGLAIAAVLVIRRFQDRERLLPSLFSERKR